MVSFLYKTYKSHYEVNLFNSITSYIFYLISNCVPARKFEEVAEKQEICAKELKTLKTLKTELETENVELTSNNDQLFEANKN